MTHESQQFPTGNEDISSKPSDDQMYKEQVKKELNTLNDHSSVEPEFFKLRGAAYDKLEELATGQLRRYRRVLYELLDEENYSLSTKLSAEEVLWEVN